MRILLNGAWRELPPAPTLASLLHACGYAEAIVATAVNGEFVPARARERTAVRDGDRVEVLAPMQGG